MRKLLSTLLAVSMLASNMSMALSAEETLSSSEKSEPARIESQAPQETETTATVPETTEGSVPETTEETVPETTEETIPETTEESVPETTEETVPETTEAVVPETTEETVPETTEAAVPETTEETVPETTEGMIVEEGSEKAEAAMLAADDVELNETNFPDPIFRQYISDYCDFDSDGILTKQERESLTEIDIFNEQLENIQGVSNFPNISGIRISGASSLSLDTSSLSSLQSLRLTNVKLKDTLDIRSLAALDAIDFMGVEMGDLIGNGHAALENVTIRESKANNLNFSGCTNLTNLNASNIKASSLDLSNCAKLLTASCFGAGVKALNVNGCTALTNLEISGNEMNSLDLTGAPELQHVSVGGSPLTELKADHLQKLKTISCENTNLKVLDLTGCSVLESVQCEGSKLEQLILAGCTKLDAIYCSGNRLQELDLSQNPNLTLVFCDNNQLTCLDMPENDGILSVYNNILFVKSRDVLFSDLPAQFDPSRVHDVQGGSLEKDRFIITDSELTYIYDCNKTQPAEFKLICDAAPEGIPVNDQIFPDKAFRAYIQENIDKNHNGYLSDAECNAVKQIDIGAHPYRPGAVRSLKGIEKFQKLQELKCSFNPLGKIDLTQLPNLTTLYAQRCELTELDVSKCRYMMYLIVDDNYLKTLDVTKCPQLITLIISYNSVSELNLANNKDLVFLHVAGNHLTELDVSKNLNLRQVDFSGNHLSCADFSNNTYLGEIRGSYNSRNIRLIDGKFDMKTIKGLDISKVSNVEEAVMDENGILTVPADTYSVAYNYDCGKGHVVSFMLSVMREEPVLKKGVPATCTKEGIMDYYEMDGMKYIEKNGVFYEASEEDLIVPALGHNYTSQVIKEPTETEQGVRRFQCTRCDHSYEEKIPVLSGKTQFTDIPQDLYCYEPVQWAVEKGITKGMDAEHFGPEVPCIRRHVVMFLWRAMGKPEPRSMANPFVDVKHNSFEKAILWAYYEGITTGKDASHFNPEGICSRKQIVTFLWRANGKPEPKNPASFPDVKNGRFAKPIYWAAENGITGGYKDGTFRPDATCTRGQIVAFLYRNNAN